MANRGKGAPLDRSVPGGITNERQATPMFSDGRMNGPVGGPKDPPRTPDPLMYLSGEGYVAPSGSPSDSVTVKATSAPNSHFGREK